MANKYLSVALMHMAKAITSGGLVDHLVEAVRAVADMSISGSEKRALVMAKLNDAKSDLAIAAAGTAGYLINLVFEVAVTYVTMHVRES